MKKMFVFDMDGTLLNSKHQISDYNIEALKKIQSKGHKIVFCSGRSYFDLKQFLNHKFKADYLVCNNGTYIYDVNNHKFHFTQTLDSDAILKAFEIATFYCPLVGVHTIEGAYRSTLCFNPIKPIWYPKILENQTIMFKSKYDYPYQQLLEIIKNQKVTQVAFCLDSIEAQKLANELKNKFGHRFNIVITSENFVDLNYYGINKLSGLKHLCQLINFKLEQIIAFGDSDNDLEMLQHVGHSIAMSNGSAQVKAIAKEVIEDHNSPAIGNKINQILKES